MNLIKRYSGELVWLGIIAVVLIRIAMNWMGS
jgi:hypothetical protein